MHKQLSKQGQSEELTPEMAREIARSAKRRPSFVDFLRLPLFWIRRLFYRRPKTDDSLDEYGLPAAWRRTPKDAAMHIPFAIETSSDWELFRSWCVDNDVEPIPATPESVLQYLSDIPAAGRQDAWNAIDNKYESLYWHTGACPHCTLWIGFGMDVTTDGLISLREDAANRFRERFGVINL